MEDKSHIFEGRQVVLHVRDRICTSARDLMQSEIFVDAVQRYWDKLVGQESPLCKPFLSPEHGMQPQARIVELMRVLSSIPLDQAAVMLSWAAHLTQEENRRALHEFVEGFYNYWRNLDRFMILHSEPGPSGFDQRPYRSFNATAENLSHIVRGLYRDICENIVNEHPRVYRQVAAGCDVALIAVPLKTNMPAEYNDLLSKIPLIRQIMLNPPMIIDPPMNKRTGEFAKVDTNPLRAMQLESQEWLCFPAKVGPVTVFVYFHQMFMGLGCALCNLFELADEKDIQRGPDAIYLFGAPPAPLKSYGELPTVFYEDAANDLLVAAVPGESRFGYFGYLKKMILTLHNIVMMKRGRMPFHGAMVRIVLKNDIAANVLIIGDTATGKSESLEALRRIGDNQLEELRIIADDMGSLDINASGRVCGYGTEIGAFVRLDDLQQGYAFEQIDRAIFMSPQKINARVVLPVTSMQEVLRGYPVDYLLYANNYEQVDAEHPVLACFGDAASALTTFREGAAMAKGTTTSTGLVHSYFANIFGAPQYRDLHEGLAVRIFEAAFEANTVVAQFRTRLGIPGYETKGPEEAAGALLDLIRNRKSAASIC